MRVGWVAVVLSIFFVGTGSAQADGLTAAEVERLGRGGTVTRTQSLEQDDHRYVGGLTYTLVDAPPDELTALLEDVQGWGRFLPKTRDSRTVGTAGGDVLVELTHGSALMHVTYTMRIHRSGNAVRFWMDPSRPHDIDDVWGFFRTEPFDAGRTLITYGVLIDIGAGLLRDLFEDRVREVALTVPERVRGVLARRRSAAYESSLVTRAAARY